MLTIALAVFLVALQFGDWYSTNRARNHGTIESNPVIDWLIKHAGFTTAMVVKVLFVSSLAFLLTLFPHPLDYFGLVVADALFCWVVWHNWKLV